MSLVALFIGSIHLMARVIWVVTPNYTSAIGTIARRRPELYHTDTLGHITVHGIALTIALIIVFIILVVVMVILKIKESRRTQFRSSWVSHPSTEEIRVVTGKHSAIHRD